MLHETTKVDVKKSKAKGDVAKTSAAPEKAETWRPLLDLRGEIDRVFDRAFHGWPRLGGVFSEWDPFRDRETMFGRTGVGSLPSTDVEESDTAYTVVVELPGVDEVDVDVTLSDETLSVKGEKKSEREEEEKNYHLTERSYGCFERSFRLPEDVNANKVDAAFEKGVLRVTLPKLAQAKKKSRKIDVKAAA